MCYCVLRGKSDLQCLFSSAFELPRYLGPKLAAVTDLWWAYASLTRRYPWIVEDVLKKYIYGDVVRIAPNELVFLEPQAAKDIYIAQEKNLELFVQVAPGRI